MERALKNHVDSNHLKLRGYGPRKLTGRNSSFLRINDRHSNRLVDPRFWNSLLHTGSGSKLNPLNFFRPGDGREFVSRCLKRLMLCESESRNQDSIELVRPLQQEMTPTGHFCSLNNIERKFDWKIAVKLRNSYRWKVYLQYLSKQLQFRQSVAESFQLYIPLLHLHNLYFSILLQIDQVLFRSKSESQIISGLSAFSLVT